MLRQERGLSFHPTHGNCRRRHARILEHTAYQGKLSRQMVIRAPPIWSLIRNSKRFFHKARRIRVAHSSQSSVTLRGRHRIQKRPIRGQVFRTRLLGLLNIQPLHAADHGKIGDLEKHNAADNERQELP